MTDTPDIEILTTDEAFLATEREMNRVRADAYRSDDDRICEALFDQFYELENRIRFSPPVSSTSAAVKLSVTADMTLRGIDASCDQESLEQVIAFLNPRRPFDPDERGPAGGVFEKPSEPPAPPDPDQEILRAEARIVELQGRRDALDRNDPAYSAENARLEGLIEMFYRQIQDSPTASPIAIGVKKRVHEAVFNQLRRDVIAAMRKLFQAEAPAEVGFGPPDR